MGSTAVLEQLQFWHWWALAVGLLALEAMAPGAFFLWMAVAAGIVGATLLLVPHLSWEIQLLVFSLTSVVTIVSWLAYSRSRPPENLETRLNRRGSEYIGRSFTLSQPVANGRGKLQLGETIWIITGPDCPAGTEITVTEINGSQLEFEIKSE